MAMPEKKFKEGDRVLVNGWGGENVPGTVDHVQWVYHHRMYEHVWGYFIKFDEGHRSPLTMLYIPQGYIRLQETAP